MTNENWNTTFQNVWDTAKAILIRKFIAIQAYLKKQTNKQKSQINNVTLLLGTKKTTEPKVNRRKEIIKFKAKINDIETKKTTERSMKIKVLQKDKIYKYLVRFIKKKR